MSPARVLALSVAAMVAYALARREPANVVVQPRPSATTAPAFSGSRRTVAPSFRERGTGDPAIGTGASGGRFAVFRTPLSPDPEWPASSFFDEIRRTYGVDPRKTRAIVTESGSMVHVMRGRRHLCLESDDAVTCRTMREAQQGQVVSVERCGPGMAPGVSRIVGVVPDRVAWVSLEWRGGGSRTLTPLNNVYSAEVEGIVERVVIETEGRRHSVQLEPPSGYWLFGCPAVVADAG